VEVTGVEVGAGKFTLTAKAAPIAPFWPFFGLMLLHSIFYVPTISITCVDASPQKMCAYPAGKRIYTWAGNSYALAVAALNPRDCQPAKAATHEDRPRVHTDH
jgi:hypothetical protein